MDEYTITYRGSSMFPTLKTGDILRVVQYNRREIHPGDVIAFNSSNGAALIVHRVVTVGQNGIRTKGDNNELNDDWLLSSNDVVGRIVSVNRDKKKIIILNGLWGQQYLRTVRTMKCIYNALSFVILRSIYHWIAKIGIFRYLFTNRVDIRLCCFKRCNELELQLLLGRRVIGRLLPGKRQWYIKSPFRLIIDEKSLPTNNLVDRASSQHSFF